ncbi:MAG: hypothetical protein L0287_12690 [Anaerolineae bacterium]|nr:hypothetical protein [Anaerolineae bacterium]MCI0608329.1 hypothetical protein [Anaerolineae bacterium]
MFWQKIRSGVMFVVSLITCPCHLPVTMPLILTLLAGTPLAVWIAQHGGWVYDTMTAVFILSLALGWIWMGSSDKNTREVCEPREMTSPRMANVSESDETPRLSEYRR